MANKKMNEIQKAIKLLTNFCKSKKECSEKCPLYKSKYGCIIEIPDNWNIAELMLIDFGENEE